LFLVLQSLVLPPTIPLFPLPNVVLFPGVFLPLHIFEPRYRTLTQEALAGDRIIGISLLQPGYEADYEGRPSIYAVGCAGVVSHSEKTSDGRYNIVLNGIEKFRVTEEVPGGAYRRGRIDRLPEPVTDADRMAIRQARPRIESLLLSALKASEVQIPPSLSDEDLLHALCQYLEFMPAERQALLECDGTVARCHALMELLEMQALLVRHAMQPPRGVH
jgi:Lon protease-like protein